MYKVILKIDNGDRLLHSQLGLDAVDQLINPTIEYKLNSVNLFKFTIRKEHSIIQAIKDNSIEKAILALMVDFYVSVKKLTENDRVELRELLYPIVKEVTEEPIEVNS